MTACAIALNSMSELPNSQPLADHYSREQHHPQIHGTATDTWMAPSYARILIINFRWILLIQHHSQTPHLIAVNWLLVIKMLSLRALYIIAYCWSNNLWDLLVSCHLKATPMLSRHMEAVLVANPQWPCACKLEKVQTQSLGLTTIILL